MKKGGLSVANQMSAASVVKSVPLPSEKLADYSMNSSRNLTLSKVGKVFSDNRQSDVFMNKVAKSPPISNRRSDSDGR